MQPSLVQRLRDSVTQCRALDRSQLLTEAADEIERLREAIRRLADQVATLSVCNDNVTVTVDATLTDAEREAIEGAITNMESRGVWAWPATLRGLLERLA